MSISSLVLELWQFPFIRDSREIQKSENRSEFCPISGDWGKLRIPNLARTSLIKCYWMLLNAEATAFTIFELLRENRKPTGDGKGGRWGGGKLTPPHPFHPRSGLNEFLAFLGLYTSTWLFAYHWRCHILTKLVMILLFLKYKQIGINSSAQKIWVFQVADFN